MKSCLRVAILFLACAHPLFSFAADPVRGIVLNQTTGRPAGGDQVVLLGEGMQEQARAVTDSQGAFVLPAASSQARYVVRVLHQGVSYDQTVGGAVQLEIRVFNTVPKIQGLKGKMGIAQIGSDGKTVTV